MRPWIGWAVSVMVLLGCITPFLGIEAGSAGAAGDPGLDAYIVSDPLAHAISAPAAQLDASASGLAGIEKSAAAASGMTTATAIEGWHRTGVTTKAVVVELVAINGPNQSQTQIATQANAAASAALGTFCSGATASDPLVYERVSQVPHSGFVECAVSPDGLHAEAITMARANIFSMIISSSATVSRSKLVSIALKQYRQLPTHDYFTGGSASPLT